MAIPVEKLDNLHLINIVKLLVRASERYAAKVTAFYISTPGPTAEGAELAFEAEFDYVMENEEQIALDWLQRQPIFPFLKQEMIKRGLVENFDLEILEPIHAPESFSRRILMVLQKLSYLARRPK